MASRPIKLSAENLAKLKASVAKPKFDRSSVKTGIVHLGVGGFHRSHQAMYTHKVLEDDPNWGICGVGLVPGDKKMQDILRSQDNLYTLISKNSKATSIEVIGSIVDYMYAGNRGNATAAVIDRLASPETRIASLTVTEKAYMVDDSTGDLDVKNIMIEQDLANPHLPVTPVGYIVAGLKKRMDSGMAPYTVLSCDNLPMNGHLTERVVGQYAEIVDPTLAAWIKENTAFPSTMVDRITPSTTDADIEYLSKAYEIEDAWPVCAEDYTQWVIEDNFPLGRPEWEKTGALMVADVEPYELMKLRLLNGSHSALAYLSYLAGHHNVHLAMEDDLVYDFIERYMNAVTPTVPDVPGVDLSAYKDTLRERFSNPNVSDQVTRLAEDGSKKVVGFIRGPISELLASGKDTAPIAAAVAGWIRFCRGYDEKGVKIEIKDPQAEALKQAANQVKVHGSSCFLKKFLSEEIGTNKTFVGQVDGFLQTLDNTGARSLLAQLAEQ
ncbi:hypothetical protein AAMO2058_000642500 [Amorphochlora amoebiformis]|uniref:mannitol 2-dehydrogenase n=1 Tax=Amorphochlora amoebiformis TaxID=1561963 RepID=A0A7S0DS56_9EUKA|mmetsp:Transcript_438/g.647  ORF Transcript_438/g.647 Transcript_438/m.647 type:complete len:495 (+) Transcript_438:95-1579(+)|eukprot:214654-Amorphochlora_amoeboformis.AAC.1